MITTARVLIISDSSTDAEMLTELVSAEFSTVESSTDPDRYPRDVDRNRPEILVLAFRATSAAERHYLGILRHSQYASRQPHRTVLLCTKEDINEAYHLCRKQYFDDYVLFWPIGHDAPRLKMSIYQALSQMRAAAAHGAHTGVFAVRAHSTSERAERHEHGDRDDEPVIVAPDSDPLIVLIDDDAFQHKIFERALAESGWRTAGAHSAEEAFEILERECPAAILMDFDMPDVNGVEMTRRLKSAERLRDVPIIMLTGHSTREIAFESLNAGAVDFIVKPFRREALLERIRHHLSRSSSAPPLVPETTAGEVS